MRSFCAKSCASATSRREAKLSGALYALVLWLHTIVPVVDHVLLAVDSEVESALLHYFWPPL
jgi:hypothetical protein